MSRIAYVDGQFMPLAEARIPVEDRGLQFADAVYEVWAVRAGRLMDEEGHYARLARSLGELRIRQPISAASLKLVIRELIARNRLRDGLVYLQVSRGVARRDHAFPAAARPSVILTARRLDMAKADKRAAAGIRVMSVADNRWGRVDIKTVGLLPNVLAKQAALESGFDDAWLVDGDIVTEGTAQNAWIVDEHGVLRTHPVGHDILRGITRDAVAAVAARLGHRLEERAFTIEEARKAREAFITSATSFVTPVTGIDQTVISGGKPGPVALALRAAYLEQCR